MKAIVKVPQGISASINDYVLTIKGPKGSTSKVLKSPLGSVDVKGDEVIIESPIESRRGKTIVNTFKSHIKNLIKGVTNGYEARLKICYSHFPITVKVNGKNISIENLGGEKTPRMTSITGDAKISVEGAEVVVTGINKEEVGQTAASIEKTSKIKHKDSRLFQDGIWITKKPGKDGL